MPRPIVPEGEASVFGITANIVSNVIGGGCLLLPSAFHDASLLPGIFGLLLMGFLAIMSIFYMILCCEKTKRYTYKDLLSIGVHPKAAYFFELVLFSYTYLILVGWARIIVDSMPPVAEQFFNLSDSSAFTSKWFWLLAAACIFFPLSSLKQLAHLTWSSVIGFLTILYVAFVMLGRLADGFYTKNWDPNDTFPCSTWNSSAFPVNSSMWEIDPPQTETIHNDIKLFDITFLFVSAFPQFSVAFSCHYNIPPFFAELRRRTPMRMLRASAAAYAIIASFYVFVGTTGILTFGDGIKQAQGDVLKCYSFADTPMNIGRLLMFFHFCCVFPIVAIATRRSFNSIVFPGKQLSHPILIVEAFFIVLTCSVIAYLVPGIGIVFTLDGAFFGLSIVLIIPGLFYYKIFADDFDLATAEAKLEEIQREQERQKLLKEQGKKGSEVADSLATIEATSSSPQHHHHHQHRHHPHHHDTGFIPGEVVSDGSSSKSDDDENNNNNNNVNASSPKYVTSDSQIRDDQGYGTYSETNVNDAQAEYLLQQQNQHQTTESIPTEWDKYLQGFVEKPSRTLRYMSMFSMLFGFAMSILSLVNAFKSIAEGNS